MQSFKNHTKWDPWYHFFLSPIVLLNVLYCGMKLVRDPGADLAWAFLVSVALVVAVLKLRLNALKVQDRLICLEEQLRLEKIMGDGSAQLIGSISQDQWIALRFASDDELTILARRAVEENLEQDQIKEAIRQWRPDNHRV